MVKARAREIRKMSSSLDRSIELSALMDLRLAFGPGTRLWALRSREELCYDWLYFKGNHPSASFRDFALRLYAHEKEHALESMSMREIRRRIAVVFRAYRIRKRSGTRRLVASSCRPQAGQATPLNGKHRPPGSGTEVLIGSIPFQDSRRLPHGIDKRPH
jgi:hypothetical protein